MRRISLALLLAAVGSALSLATLTALHRTLTWPSVERFDHGLQLGLHAHATHALTAAMLTLTFIGSIKFFFPAVTLWIGYLGAHRRRREAVLLACAIPWALVLNETLKLHFHRARPGLPWSIGDEHTYSFPSGHSLFAVVLYGMLAWLALERGHRWPIGFAVAMPLAIGLSRVYLGMHYPTDVLGGYIVGLFWLCAVMAMERFVRPPQSRSSS